MDKQYYGLQRRMEHRPELFTEAQRRALQFASQLIASTLIQGRKVYVAGYGIYDYLSQYFAAMMQTGLDIERPALPVVALRADAAMAAGTESQQGIEQALDRQLKLQVSQNDILIILTDHTVPAKPWQLLETSHRKNLSLIFLGDEPSSIRQHAVEEQVIFLNTGDEHATFVYENCVTLLHQLYHTVEQQLFG